MYKPDVVRSNSPLCPSLGGLVDITWLNDRGEQFLIPEN